MLRNSFVNVVQGVGTSVVSTQSVLPDNSTHSITKDSRIDVNPQYNADFSGNNSHPLFLHNNDHPGLILIAKKLVGPDNFAP